MKNCLSLVEAQVTKQQPDMRDGDLRAEGHSCVEQCIGENVSKSNHFWGLKNMTGRKYVSD